MSTITDTCKNYWHGSGYYRLFWSDGGQDWTNDGAIWFDYEDELEAEISSALNFETDSHRLCIERVGSPSNARESVFNGLSEFVNLAENLSDDDAQNIIDRETLHAILEMLVFVASRAYIEELSGPAFDALCLAESCADLPYYSVLANVQDLAERVFCEANFIESVSEYKED